VIVRHGVVDPGAGIAPVDRRLEPPEDPRTISTFPRDIAYAVSRAVAQRKAELRRRGRVEWYRDSCFRV
jgi:hypothetical protein